MTTKAIDYKAVLADLKAKRAALDQTIASVEVFLGESPSGKVAVSTNGAQSPTIELDTFVGLSIIQAATKFLGMVGRPARKAEFITDALRRGGLDVTRASVATVLSRGNDEVKRVGRGLWGLNDWY